MQFEGYFRRKKIREFEGHYINFMKLKQHVKSPDLGVEISGSNRSLNGATNKFHDTMLKELGNLQEFTKSQIISVKSSIKIAGGRNSSTVVKLFKRLESFVNLNYLAIDHIIQLRETWTDRKIRSVYIKLIFEHDWIRLDFPAYMERLFPRELNAFKEDLFREEMGLDDRQPIAHSSAHWVKIDDIHRIQRLCSIQIKSELQNAARIGKFSDDPDCPYKIEEDAISVVYFDNVHGELFHRWVAGESNAVMVRICWSGEEPELVAFELVMKGSYFNSVQSINFKQDEVDLFLKDELPLDSMQARWRGDGIPYTEQVQNGKVFQALRELVEAKQIRPAFQTSFARTEYKTPDVNVSLLSDLVFARLPLNILGNQSWFRTDLQDIGVHLPQVDNTFVEKSVDAISDELRELVAPAHGALIVKATNPNSLELPEWVAGLLRSSRITHVENWNLFLHSNLVFQKDAVRFKPSWGEANFLTGSFDRKKSIVSSFYETGRTLSRKLRDSVVGLSKTSQTLRAVNPPPDVSKSSFQFRPSVTQPAI